MKRKSIISLIIAFSLCISPTFNAIAAIGTSTTDTANSTTLVPLSDELQAKENIANDKYNTLLAKWAYNPNFIDDVNANFPSFYGGAYIDENKELVIQVTKLDDDIRKYFSDMIDVTDTRFEVVKYSFENLKAEKDNIVKKMNSNSKDDLISSISGVGISFMKNSVSLYLYLPENISTADTIDESVKNKISSFENIDIIVTDKKEKEIASVQPGSGITNGIYTRSVGFWAVSGSDVGIVTAPHSTISQGTIMTINSQTFGTAGTPHYGGNLDAVFIKRTNSNFTESRHVPSWGFELKSKSYTFLAVGSIVFSYGMTSLAGIGTVKDTNYTSRSGISDTVLTTIIAQEGDSGGIVAGSGDTSSRYTAGIMIGITGAGEMCYVKAGNIAVGLGISVY